jgi:hypothetical protein
MKLSLKTGEVTRLPTPESTAQLVALLDAWEPNLPDAGRAAEFLRRPPPGRPVLFRDDDLVIQAFELQLRRRMSRKSACMHVAKTVTGFSTTSKPESVARRIGNKLGAMEADSAGQKVLAGIRELIVLSRPRRR